MENSLLIPALPTLAATSLLPSLPLISRERRAAYPLDLVKPGDGRARKTGGSHALVVERFVSKRHLLRRELILEADPRGASE